MLQQLMHCICEACKILLVEKNICRTGVMCQIGYVFCVVYSILPL